MENDNFCTSAAAFFQGGSFASAESILAFAMNMFYNNELRNNLIGQDFVEPRESLMEFDATRDSFLFFDGRSYS